MWNWAYPYKFEQLVDLVSQRGLLFTFDGSAFGPAIDVEHTWDDGRDASIDAAERQAAALAADF